MTRPVHVPRDVVTIPAYDDDARWAALEARRDPVWPWLLANGVRHFVPADAPIHVTRDGRTAYLERFLVRTPSPWNRESNGRRDRYAYAAVPVDLLRRLVGYPITHPLSGYEPELARRLRLP